MAPNKKQKKGSGKAAAKPPAPAKPKEEEEEQEEDAAAAVLRYIPDILERVLSFLPKPADVRRCAAVSKSFLAAARSESMWKARAALLPTVELSGATPGHEELLVQRMSMHVEKLLVRATSATLFFWLWLFLSSFAHTFFIFLFKDWEDSPFSREDLPGFDKEFGCSPEAYRILLAEYLKFMTIQRDTPPGTLLQPRCVSAFFGFIPPKHCKHYLTTPRDAARSSTRRGTRTSCAPRTTTSSATTSSGSTSTTCPAPRASTGLNTRTR
jgi:hypothetical protein